MLLLRCYYCELHSTTGLAVLQSAAGVVQRTDCVCPLVSTWSVLIEVCNWGEGGTDRHVQHTQHTLLHKHTSTYLNTKQRCSRARHTHNALCFMHSNKNIQYICACTYTNTYLTHKHLPPTYTHLDFTIKYQQVNKPHRVASSAHVSHLALQSPAPAAAHPCWWWAEQSQGLYQLCCSSCACTGQPSGVQGQIKGQTVVKVHRMGSSRSPIYFCARNCCLPQEHTQWNTLDITSDKSIESTHTKLILNQELLY